MKTNILLIGMPGCGKSSIGKALSKSMDLKYIDMDDYIEKKTGKAISELFENGEDYFRNIETECAKELSNRENMLISGGGGIILRKENMDYLKKTSTVIFINRSVKNLLKSKNLGANRPLLKDNENHIYNLYNDRIGLYNKYADIEVDNNGYFKNCVEEIMRKIR